MRIGLLVVAVLALVGFVAVALVLPRMEEAELQEAAEALIAGADGARQQVAANAEKAGRLVGAGKGVKIAGRNDGDLGQMKWIVAEDGAIRGWNEQNALEVALTPTLQAGKVSWSCRGYPLSAMPQSCGGR